MKAYILVALLVFATPFVAAETQYCTYLQEDIGMKVGTSVPGFVPYGNERIALFDLEDNVQGHVITEDKRVTAISCDPLEDPTFNVYVADTQIIDQVFSSEAPLGELDSQKASGHVIVEGQSVAKQVKKSLSFATVKILSWFGL